MHVAVPTNRFVDVGPDPAIVPERIERRLAQRSGIETLVPAFAGIVDQTNNRGLSLGHAKHPRQRIDVQIFAQRSEEAPRCLEVGKRAVTLSSGDRGHRIGE